jgi:hypothetical protein
MFARGSPPEKPYIAWISYKYHAFHSTEKKVCIELKEAFLRQDLADKKEYHDTLFRKCTLLDFYHP